MTEARRIIVSGKVQGVFYRASTKEFCERHGITGWVKNLPGGEVEIFAQGTNDKLSSLSGWCAQGPQLARVEDVKVESVEIGEFNSFTIGC